MLAAAGSRRTGAWLARADIPSTSPAAAISTSCSRRTGSHHAPVTTLTSSRRGDDSSRGDSRHRSRRRSSRSSRLGPGDAVLEVGCGEGHYLAAIAARFGCEAHGVDISGPAIDTAARRYPRLRWVVANADRFLPYAKASFRVVASVTARRNAVEFRRVLRDDGTPPGRGARTRRPHRAAHGDSRRGTLARPGREHRAELRPALHARAPRAHPSRRPSRSGFHPGRDDRLVSRTPSESASAARGARRPRRHPQP